MHITFFYSVTLVHIIFWQIKPWSSQTVWYSNEIFLNASRVVFKRSLAALIPSWKYSYLNAICYNFPNQDKILFNKSRAIRVLQITAFSPLWILLGYKKFKVLSSTHSIITVFLKACKLTLATLLSTSYGDKHRL